MHRRLQGVRVQNGEESYLVSPYIGRLRQILVQGNSLQGGAVHKLSI